MGRPRTHAIIDESTFAKVQCVTCQNFHPFTHFVKTKAKDANGESIRRKTCKHCTYGHITTGRDKQKMHLNAIRHRCKTKGMAFDLTYEDLNIPEKCPILGIPLLQSWGEAKDFQAINSPSVDKVIPSLGYVKGNVQIISSRANSFKNDATLEEVRALLNYMEKNYPRQLTSANVTPFQEEIVAVA